jgi:hypothetical protein
MGVGYSREIIYGHYLNTADSIQRGTGWHKGSTIVTKPWTGITKTGVSRHARPF